MGKLSGIVAVSAVPFGLIAGALQTKGRWLGRLRRPTQAISAYTAATGVTMSLCATRAINFTGILGKGDDGRLAVWSLAAWWPYHVGLRAKLHIQRAVSSEPLYDEVAEGWFLSGWPHSAAVLPPGLAGVVDCTSELPRRHEVPYVCLPTWDTNAVTADNIARGADFVARVMDGKGGKRILIHCAHGHGRSAAVMCAAMVKTGAAPSIDAALKVLKAGRPLVKLNKSQRAGLDEWALMTTGGK